MASWASGDGRVSGHAPARSSRLSAFLTPADTALETDRRRPFVETAFATGGVDARGGRGSCGSAGSRPRGSCRRCWRCCDRDARSPAPPWSDVNVRAPQSLAGSERRGRRHHAMNRWSRPTSGHRRGDRSFDHAVGHSPRRRPRPDESGSRQRVAASRWGRSSDAHAGLALISSVPSCCRDSRLTAGPGLREVAVEGVSAHPEALRDGRDRDRTRLE